MDEVEFPTAFFVVFVLGDTTEGDREVIIVHLGLGIFLEFVPVGDGDPFLSNFVAPSVEVSFSESLLGPSKTKLHALQS